MNNNNKVVNILEEYEKNKKIILLKEENIRYIKSFYKILEYAKDCDYYAFCDQDDVWYENKIEKAIEKLKKEDSAEVLMYFSDFDLYDENLKLKTHFKGFKYGPSFRNSLVDAITLGTCLVINQKARKELLRSENNDMCSHDWWAYFVCAGIGKVIYDRTPTIKYRRHDNNVSACGKSFISLQIYRIKNFIFGNYFKRVRKQQIQYKKYFYNQLSKENQELLDLFTTDGYNVEIVLKKLLYPKMFRQNLVDEIMLRTMFLLGKI